MTIPFKTEGPKRMKQAYQGIDELRECVDSLLLINNENIQEIFGKLTLTEASTRPTTFWPRRPRASPKSSRAKTPSTWTSPTCRP